MISSWGASPVSGDTWSLGLWAPSRSSVTCELENTTHPLERCEDGYWRTEFTAPSGARYSLNIDGQRLPDPASRLQAGDVHGSSRLVNPASYNWSTAWGGRPFHEAVIYELHIGTFTGDGSFRAAAEKMRELADLGFTAIEIMPVSHFSGGRGWGYDGVLPFAPHPAYGSPDDLRHLVEIAQQHGLMVLLDLVMNHFGPDGAYLHSITPEFFNPDRHTPWGAAIDFSQAPVRRYWMECALMWLEDYRLDGLRLDAVHQIQGEGADQFFAELGQAVSELDLGRPLHLIVEDERNEPGLRETGYYAATWNDDFHHAIHTALTGESQDYYASFSVDPIGDIARALERGHIEEGQDRSGREAPRGADCRHLPVTSFVNSIQTHDQIGNRAHGERLLSLAESADAVKTAYALLLAAPYTPMVFMGEERGATTPFLFFADYEGELAAATRKGRAAEFAGIAALGDQVPDPIDPHTFSRSNMDWSDTAEARDWQSLTQRALAFRHHHVMPLTATPRIGKAQVALVGEKAISARWIFAAGELVVLLNFGAVGEHSAIDREPDFSQFDLATDPYALAVWSTRT
ncbi:malto-oligosyltrehalose trehalohydrolase [Devosia sp. CAU 1758]